MDFNVSKFRSYKYFFFVLLKFYFLIFFHKSISSHSSVLKCKSAFLFFVELKSYPLKVLPSSTLLISSPASLHASFIPYFISPLIYQNILDLMRLRFFAFNHKCFAITRSQSFAFRLYTPSYQRCFFNNNLNHYILLKNSLESSPPPSLPDSSSVSSSTVSSSTVSSSTVSSSTVSSSTASSAASSSTASSSTASSSTSDSKILKKKKLPLRFLMLENARIPERKELHSIEEALRIVKQFANAKFEESVEAHFALNINPAKIEQAIRSIVTYPHPIGKNRTVAVITKPDKQALAKEAGADIVGGEELVPKIIKKEILFNVLICTPEMMAKISRVGKILGPRGLLPNSKMGTVTNDIKQAVAAYKGNTYQYRADRSGVVHVSIGKVGQPNEHLKENFYEIYFSIKACKSKAKSTFFKSVFLCSTMGPSVQIKRNQLI